MPAPRNVDIDADGQDLIVEVVRDLRVTVFVCDLLKGTKVTDTFLPNSDVSADSSIIVIPTDRPTLIGQILRITLLIPRRDPSRTSAEENVSFSVLIKQNDVVLDEIQVRDTLKPGEITIPHKYFRKLT